MQLIILILIVVLFCMIYDIINDPETHSDDN